MNSPFPGMDPYIEARGLWGDFHDDLIHEIKNALALTAPERYLVRTEERSYVVLVEPEGKESHALYPDVRVTTPAPGRRPARKGKGVAVAEPAAESRARPMSIRALVEEEYRETFVEIYEADPEQRLVTSIEVLSPTNKRKGSPGWHEYLRKRQGLLLSDVNLVEVDLLRRGERMPMRDDWPDSPYTLLVYRPNKERRCQVWEAHWRSPVPEIPVPLLKPDADLPLRLQPMIETTYQRSRYFRSIDYRKPLEPSLSPDEVAWLEQQLSGRSDTA
jgi:hypothetical protein